MTTDRDLLRLAPCPFCGGEAFVRILNGGQQIICCEGEECFGPRTTAFTLQDATVQWNTRAISAEPCAVKALENELFNQGIDAAVELASRWSREAAEFRGDPGCAIQSNVCRNLTVALINLRRPLSGLGESSTSSDGGVEARHAATGNTLGSVPREEMSSSATGFERATVREAAIQPCAGVAPGPSEATPSTAGSVREALEADERSLCAAADEAYFKAGNTSDPQDWLNAGLLARQHRNALEKLRTLSAPVEAPVAWLRDLPGNEMKPDGRCYDIVFVDPQDARYRPLYATQHPLPSRDELERSVRFNSNPLLTDRAIDEQAKKIVGALLTLLGGSAHGR